MYRDEILGHYKNPRNIGELETGIDAEAENPSCGDRTHVYLEVEDGKIAGMRHETDGCAISTAATSILSREIAGMEVNEVLELDRDWMVETLGVEVSPMRMKCAILGLKTVQEALEKEV
ncbi:MAG: iron-sulfur cluster assembly scaffold protein [Candidatus Nanohaloarchaea archaeon]